MKNSKTILILLILISGIAIGAFYFFNTQNNSTSEEHDNYEATRTSTNENVDNNSSNTNKSEQQTENSDIATTDKNQSPPTETTISTFSTKIYTKDSARQNNINITCSSLNNTIVKNGETFSFCTTVGQSTTAKGYQKADIFDKNGNKKKGLRWW